nr:unnamed protein product [Timema douglasi]
MALGSEDPYGQLKWLAETLLQAEQDGEKVHLLYHIQMQSCLPTWSREYHKIIDRFENIITAQFNGHTHTDEFQVFHSVSNLTRANSVLFNGGSGTANANVNPNYRIYTVDPDSLYVLDAETWIYNLTDANLSPKINPKWFLEYSMREAFGVSTLLPQALSSLTHSMARDHALMRQYYRFYVKQADTSPASGCDDACLKGVLCNIVNVQNGNTTNCEILTAEYDQTLL